VLADQRETSGYPSRWPLPFPVERFVVREAEEAAWVVESDGGAWGQIAVLTVPEDFGRHWTDPLGVPTTALAAIGAFFVDPAHRGSGAGRALLDEAVAWIRARDRTPVLDVLPHHERARRIYEAAGWRTVGEAHPPWLPATEPPVILMALDPA
jgi:GNAT superfamily N-acetyltransferase